MPDPMNKDTAFGLGLESVLLRGLGVQQGLGPGGPEAARMLGGMFGLDIPGVQTSGAAEAAGGAVARAPVTPSPEDLQAIQEAEALGQAYPALGPMNLAGGLMRMPGVPMVSTRNLEAAAARPRQALQAAQGQIASAEGLRQQGVQKQRSGLLSEANLGVERAQQEAAEMEGAAGVWAQKASEWEKLEQDARLRVESNMAAYQKALDDLKASKIGQKPQSVGDRLGIAIAVALGAMGQAFIGGENNALAIIQAAAERELQTQQAETARRQAVVGESANALQIAQRTLGDVPQAREAARLAIYGQAKDKVAQFALRTKDKEIRAKAQMLYGQLDTEEAAGREKLQQGLLDNELRTSQMEIGAEQAVLGAKRQNAAAAAAAVRTVPQMPPGLKLADPTKPPPSKDQLEKFQARFSGYKRLVGVLGEMQKEREASGVAGKLGPKGEVLVKEAVGAWADSNGYSAEAKQRILADPSLAGFSDVSDLGFVMDRLEALRQGADRNIGTEASTYNLTLDLGTGSRRRVR